MIRVVCAVIVEEGKVLVCQRPLEKAEGGKWEFPGGKVEDGESDEVALRREMTEELALGISVGEQLGESQSRDLQLIAYRCDRKGGGWELREHLDARMIDRKAGDLLDWAELDIPLWTTIKDRLLQS